MIKWCQNIVVITLLTFLASVSAYAQLSNYYITQASSADVTQGATDQVVLRINLRCDGPTSLEAVRVRIDGIYNDANFGNVNVYFTGSSPTFSTTTLFGTQTAPLVVANNYQIGGTETLAAGDNYLWICLDVDASATIGEAIDIKFNGVTTDGTLLPITTFENNPDGERTIVAGTIESNCGDGIDNDGDGLIDCYDSNCFGSIECNGNYYGTDVECEESAPPLGYNALVRKWESEDVENDGRTMPMVGDIDGDCIPEIVTLSEGPDVVNIHNGITGELELQFSVTVQNENTWGAIAIGDINNDGLGEILVMNTAPRIVAYTNTGVELWTSSTSLNKESSHIAIADFDGDGNPEVYCEDRIYNGQTGVEILNTGGNRGDQGGNNAQSLAADVLSDSYCANCSGLELIAGAEVYSIDISGTTSNLELDVNASMSLGGRRSTNGYVSVGDLQNDGVPDVVVAGLWNCGSTCRGAVYGYTPETGAIISTGFKMSDFTNQNASGNVGKALLADLDGDGDLEIVLGGMNMMGVLDHTFTEVWSRDDLGDGNSGQCPATAFDLDNDGTMEIIYRDQTDVHIINSASGTSIVSAECFSQTRAEYPTIVDVDLDGQADILCVCATGSGSDNGPVVAFNDDTYKWTSARSTWHQHSYQPAYINDDLSIPTTIADGSLAGMNNFMVQSALINSSGDPIVVPQTDMEVMIDSIVEATTCDTDSATAYVSICNTAGQFLDTNLIYLSLYNGDPASGGTLIKTIQYDIDSNFVYDNVLCNTTTPSLSNTLCMSLSFNITPGDYTLYAAVNDDGSSPATSPVTSFDECNVSNNINNTAVACVSATPIEGIILSGSNVLGHNKLTWELYGSGFEEYSYQIFKSIDGKNYTKISEVDFGNNEFEDHLTGISCYYYIDAKSIETQHKVRSNSIHIRGNEQVRVASLSNGNLEISVSGIEDLQLSLTLFDLAGKRISTYELDKTNGSIATSIQTQLPSGMYIAQINGLNTGTLYTIERVLIQH